MLPRPQLPQGGLAEYARIEGFEAAAREQRAIEERRRLEGRRRRPVRPFNAPAPATRKLLRRLLPRRT